MTLPPANAGCPVEAAAPTWIRRVSPFSVPSETIAIARSLGLSLPASGRTR